MIINNKTIYTMVCEPQTEEIYKYENILRHKYLYNKLKEYIKCSFDFHIGPSVFPSLIDSLVEDFFDCSSDDGIEEFLKNNTNLINEYVFDYDEQENILYMEEKND